MQTALHIPTFIERKIAVCRIRMGFFSRTFGRKDAEQSEATSPALDSGVAPPPAPEISAGTSFSIPSV